MAHFHGSITSTHLHGNGDVPGGVDAAADSPTAVSGTATGAAGTTAQITITPASTGGTPTGFRYQLETPTDSGTWVTVAGTTANPTGPGVHTFDATGLTPGMQVTPRVAALRTGHADSTYTVGAPFYLDLVVGGGGEITPPLARVLSAPPSGNGPAFARRGRNLSLRTR